MEEAFSRTRMLIGQDALTFLHQAHVAVFGVGGVGGYVVEVLARSGIGQISLYDNDTVNVSNLNRQIIALHSTIGAYKVEVAAQRIADINPQCKVHAHRMFYLPALAEEIDFNQFDYVVDCIDTTTAKIDLAHRCFKANIPIIASMGAANKMNPAGFRITDIYQTQIGPLARILRKKLRKLGVTHLKVVYSEEEPCKTFLQPTATNDDKQEANTSKRPTPASTAYVPAAAGIIIGGEVVNDLIRRSTTSPISSCVPNCF